MHGVYINTAIAARVTRRSLHRVLLGSLALALATAAAEAKEPAPAAEGWQRPAAAVAQHAHERSGWAWILRQFGADAALLDRLATNDIAGVIATLSPAAARGDPVAVRSLGWLSWRCAVHRDDATLVDWASSQRQAARALNAADAAWFTEMIDRDLASERALGSACRQLPDGEQLKDSLTRLADAGDGASSYVLILEASTGLEIDRLSRQTAIQGFAQGEFEYGYALLRKSQPAVPQVGDPSGMEFLRHAAITLPRALGNLGACEVQGCSGAPTTDLTAGLADLRRAASLGFPESLLDVSPSLPLSAMSADEREAWVLFHNWLQLHGCGISGLNNTWMRSIRISLDAASVTPTARALANDYWARYGAGALAARGSE